jgi:hypothetical protein
MTQDNRADHKPHTAPAAPTNAVDVSPEALRADIWSKTGQGEELALREAKMGSEGEIDDMSDLVAAETPDTVKRISDPHIADPKTGS